MAVVEELLLPALSIFLPWKTWTELSLKLCARLPLFDNEVNQALAAVKRFSDTEADQLSVWQQWHRFHRLVDRADYFLTRTRGKSWMDKWLKKQGESHLPATEKPCLYVTFHYGQGFLGVKIFQ